eukprot:GFUD01030148.1.p1 GENE.GFUD01030148.1~~GFUD01030148.1.p1  ORF type:complete len:337 (-),score=76.04 GFUD01030148.1:317-1327(-)
MASSEKFCLRWNDFESNISVAFRELREEKDFFDVTLACDDSQIQAHKVILSACSPFFRNVLRRNPHQHPLLYLKGVKYSELMSVLNFMYMGEVNVAQEELNSFLSVAEDLRVKGLTQNNSEGSSKVLTKQEPPKQAIKPRDPPDRDPVPPPKRPRPITSTPQISTPAPFSRQTYQPVEDDDIQEVVPVKSEPRDPPLPQPVVSAERQQVVYQDQQDMVEEHDQGTVALDESYAEESYDYGQYGEGYDDGTGMMDPNTGMAMGGDGNKDSAIEAKMWKNPSGLWQCTDCDHTSQQPTNMRNHIEVKHVFTSGYYCQQCSKFCRTKNALSIHRTRYKH